MTDSHEHQSNVENIGVRRHSEAIQREQLLTAYSALSYTNFDSSYTIPVPSSRPDFASSMPDLDINIADDNNIFSALDDLVIPAGIEPFTDYDSLHERERLHREVELLMMQAEQDDEFGVDGLEDDATVTNVTENLWNMGQLNLLYFTCSITSMIP